MWAEATLQHDWSVEQAHGRLYRSTCTRPARSGPTVSALPDRDSEARAQADRDRQAAAERLRKELEDEDLAAQRKAAEARQAAEKQRRDQEAARLAEEKRLKEEEANGVARTLAATVTELDRRGYEVKLITPDRFTTVPLLGYSSIRLALAPRFSARKMLDAFVPDVVHISTEGPIGWSARSWCLARNLPFTTAFHTRFPEYAAVRTGISAERFWPIMRRFHAPSSAVLVATPGLAEELATRGIAQSHLWSRGIDRWLFRPDGPLHPEIASLPRPILLNVGRVAPEKNLEAFLGAPVAGSKVVIGEGPAVAELARRFPETHFVGPLAGEELASAYRSDDAFVFPSRTDTFGLVMIEALACGVPVAALPASGPIDVVGRTGRGPDDQFPATIAALHTDLSMAITRALRLDRQAAAVFGGRFSWASATDQFITAVQRAAARGAQSCDLAPA